MYVWDPKPQQMPSLSDDVENQIVESFLKVPMQKGSNYSSHKAFNVSANDDENHNKIFT